MMSRVPGAIENEQGIRNSANGPTGLLRSALRLGFPLLLLGTTSIVFWIFGIRFGPWWQRGAIAGFAFMAPLSLAIPTARWFGRLQTPQGVVIGSMIVSTVRAGVLVCGGLAVFLCGDPTEAKSIDVLGFWGILIVSHLSCLIGEVIAKPWKL